MSKLHSKIISLQFIHKIIHSHNVQQFQYLWHIKDHFQIPHNFSGVRHAQHVPLNTT